MRVGKEKKNHINEDKFIELLHIVLIEEPEAHLHSQVQQVFIKKAYGVLRNHEDLKDKKNYNTQLIISTHSSYIAHEIDFACLRYFKRMSPEKDKDTPFSDVVNLSMIFGPDDETSKFVSRYIKTTHCDLFFSDATILVEGPAERMLVPQFINYYLPVLNQCYISLLEIGGSHAHKLKPLLKSLGITTLIITDLDSIEENSIKKVYPEKEKKYRTGNNTIIHWCPKKQLLDDVLSVRFEDKIENNYIRVAYQYEITLDDIENKTDSDSKMTIIPYTFEDALVFSNIEVFKELKNIK
jgi:predicted ATP-dependent endonuclease of OLD family